MERKHEVPPPGSIAAVCAVTRLMRNRMEYFKIRDLILEHISDMLQYQVPNSAAHIIFAPVATRLAATGAKMM